MSTEETIALLRTSSDGLTNSEVKRRLQIYGLNEVPEKKRNPVVQFLLRYWGPMPWLLEV
ncbi:MAG TPA: cation-transporting P-type ATPase, partial [Dehalococcoidia bacterium]|nr:cation-transporting P-type ATPase [Dehalococcoidia bacterium]